MGYWVEETSGGDGYRYSVYGGDRLTVAGTTNLRDAALVRQSLSLLESMAGRFPGIINGEDDVNGGDFVDFFNVAFAQMKTLHAYLAGGGEYQNDEEIYDPEAETRLTRAEIDHVHRTVNAHTAGMAVPYGAGGCETEEFKRAKEKKT